MAEATKPTAVAQEPAATGDLKVGRALLSVSDKRGLVDFARALADLGGEIISTGGPRPGRERGLERCPGHPRRPCKDSSSVDLRGASRCPLEGRASRDACRARNRADRL